MSTAVAMSAAGLLQADILMSTPLLLLLIGLVFAIMLTIAHRKLKVEVDPKIEAVGAALPGANCGGCGYPGCPQFAEAIVAGKAEPGECVAANDDVIQQVAELVGVEAAAGKPKRAVIHCGAKDAERKARAEYYGVATCTEANMVAGVQGCTYGCLGLGDCMRVCPFGAIEMRDGLPVVDYVACTGCNKCVETCPRGIISLKEMVDDPLIVIACSSHDTGKQVRANCNVGCIACKMCARVDEDVFEVPGNLCRVHYKPGSYKQTKDHEPAVEKCPTSCLVYVGTSIDDPHALVERKAREKAERAAAKKQAAAAAATEAGGAGAGDA